MSRDFDKAQEMVWASMEYVKVLGFRLRRTEGQRDDWKKVAQSHSDDLIACRQQLDALKAERNALRSTTIDTATGHLLDAFGSLANEPRHGSPDDEYRDRIVTKIHTIKLERDALKKERDDLWQREGIEKKRRIDVEEHFSDTISSLAALLGIDGGERSVTVAIEKLKAERDALRAQLDTERERHKQTASPLAQYAPKTVDVPRAHPVPCDPPEATHITPDGKATAQAAVKPQPGDVVRLVRVPTQQDYPMAAGTWLLDYGKPGECGTVEKPPHINCMGVAVVAMDNGWQWPLSCVEVVKGGDK